MDIGERLKRARLDAGFATMKQVSDALGLERTRYLKWEHGDAVPSLDMLVRLCRLFSVSADYLLGLDDEGEARLTADEIMVLKRMVREYGEAR